MRRLENYVRKYGPEFGPILYHALQSQAAHAGVSARLRRKIDVLTGKTPAVPRTPSVEGALPLFPEAAPALEAPEAIAIGAAIVIFVHGVLDREFYKLVGSLGGSRDEAAVVNKRQVVSKTICDLNEVFL